MDGKRGEGARRWGGRRDISWAVWTGGWGERMRVRRGMEGGEGRDERGEEGVWVWDVVQGILLGGGLGAGMGGGRVVVVICGVGGG